MRTVLLILAMFIALPSVAADPTTRVSLESARKTALARVPGVVTGEKLKHKNKDKHSYLVWSIKVQARDGSTKKVVVDADSGVIVEIKDAKSKKSKKSEDD